VTVIVLTACPVGLRGQLTRWLLEISPGVFVGHISKRVREALWEQIGELVKDGKAIMVSSSSSEQRLEFRVHRNEWEPVDMDGITLIRRNSTSAVTSHRVRANWSTASRMRRRRT